ncbi:helix-turn-helix domain-containing protein [Chitinophaga sp. 30R24]|uniref:helix-turn-helix domain-containing protein n=1 Tax=Chitinophaga sp. 30R24 TaxID=3248838 RepID=UPI003B8F3B7A
MENTTTKNSTTRQLSQLQLNGDIVMEYFTDDNAPAGYELLKDHLLLFVLKGSCTIQHGSQQYAVGTQQMILLKKNINITYHFPEVPVAYISFRIKDSLLHEISRDLALPPATQEEEQPIIITPTCKHLSAYLESLKHHFLDPASTPQALIRLKLMELMYLLNQGDQHILKQLLQYKTPFQSDISSVVEENITTPLSLQELARKAGRSLSSFKRDFKSIYNQTPSQWIREKKLEKAKELIIGTAMSVTDICNTLGFENISHFSRLFKTYHGASPSKYKEVAIAA